MNSRAQFNDPVDKMHKLLSSCGRCLKRWSATIAIKNKSKFLKTLQEREEPSMLDEIKQIQQELNFLIDQEDIK